MIPHSQFLDFVIVPAKTDFSLKTEKMCDFFDKRSYPSYVVQAGYHRARDKMIGSQHYKRHTEGK